MTFSSTRRKVMGSALAAGFSPLLVRAQDRAAYPSRPVRLIVPFAPGGSTDILGRLLSKHMFAASNQPFVVENISGASGNIGAAVVARSQPDGYTLEVGAMSTHAANGTLYKKLPFDPMNDFDTVAMLAYAINVIAISSSLPVKTFPELLAYIRANPGKLNYSSGGIASHNHLTLAMLAKAANLDIVHVPYKGGGPAVMALVQGEVNMFAGGASLLLPHARSGKVRLIAVTESTRSDLLPDVPSASEFIKGFEVTNWYGVFAPKGLDPARRSQLNQEVNRVTTLPEVAERLKDLGMVRAPVTAQQLRDILQADYKLWSGTITAMGITGE